MTKTKDNVSDVVNFGCRLNAYESQSIKEMLLKEDINDVIVFNTCAVTKESERQSRQAIRKIKKENPNKKIVVTGCAAQINSAQFEKMPEVDRVVGNGLKYDISVYKNDFDNKVLKTDIMKKEKITENYQISYFENKTRCFIRIQDGCNHRCTFCVIPFGRGNSRSVMPRSIIDEIGSVVGYGCKEIVLTGVDVTSYGNDFDVKMHLGELCKLILEECHDLPRLRLSSIDVAEIDDDIVDLIANEKRFMPYLHISAQSGDNNILKKMRRRHSKEMLIEFCNKMQMLRPEIGFGSDIIAGFPTETDEEFENTKDMLKKTNMIYNHIFTYSEREGTVAATMPQVDYHIRKQRTKNLIQQTKEQSNIFMKKMIGTKQKILCEFGNIGRCENFAPIKIIGDYKQGNIIECDILGFENDMLFTKLTV